MSKTLTEQVIELQGRLDTIEKSLGLEPDVLAADQAASLAAGAAANELASVPLPDPETVTDEDGTVTTTVHNLDGSVTVTITEPDGSSTTTTVTHKDGTIVQSQPDGTTVTQTPDGSVTTVTPDGDTTSVGADGVTVQSSSSSAPAA